VESTTPSHTTGVNSAETSSNAYTSLLLGSSSEGAVLLPTIKSDNLKNYTVDGWYGEPGASWNDSAIFGGCAICDAEDYDETDSN
jgi:hypothetical protein